MGAERWLQFSTYVEAKRAKRFLQPLDGVLRLETRGDVWFRWTGPRKLEVGHAHGHENSETAAFVCREIARRFHITRIGADSVGWYSEKDWKSEHPHGAPASYGRFVDWPTWMKEYRPEWSSHYLGRIEEQQEGRVFPALLRYLDELLESARTIEREVTARFAELDAKEGQDEPPG